MPLVESAASVFTDGYTAGQELTLPVAHGEGSYYADDETLARLHGEGRVAFTYVDNPNGSLRNVAGILNERGNVLGMMPHPERAVEDLLGGTDGRALFAGLLARAARAVAV